VPVSTAIGMTRAGARGVVWLMRGCVVAFIGR
jgi:hypothetical protein